MFAGLGAEILCRFPSRPKGLRQKMILFSRKTVLPTRKIQRIVPALAFSGVIALFACGGVSTSAQSSASNYGSPGLGHTSVHRDDYIARLVRLARNAPNFGGAVYITEGIRLYGVGYPTDSVSRMLAQAPPGVRAIWTRCAYTLKDLKAEEARLQQFGSITSMSINDDGSGIVVGTLDQRLLSTYHPDRLLHSSYAIRVIRRSLPSG